MVDLNGTDDEPTRSELLCVLVGRAQVCLLANRPGAAYSDSLRAESLLSQAVAHSFTQLPRRLRIIQLRALMALRRFTAAQKALRRCEELQMNSAALDEIRVILKQRLDESAGRFVAKERHEDKTRDDAYDVSADFIGPVKLVQHPLKGRIMVTTAKIQAGDLLIQEGPAIFRPQGQSKSYEYIISARGGEAIPAFIPHSKDSWAVHAVMDDPSLGRMIQGLAPNPEPEVNVLAEEAAGLEAFHRPTEIDLDLMRRKIATNVAGSNGNYDLRIMFSMLSHDCKANVHVYHGSSLDKVSGYALHVNRQPRPDTTQPSMQHIKALNDMEPGEELCTSYVDPERQYADRQAALSHNWRFECKCGLCQLDGSKGGDLHGRARMMNHQWPSLNDRCSNAVKSIEHAHSSTSPGQSNLPSWSRASASIIKDIKDFLRRLEATYPKGRKVRLEAAQVKFAMGRLIKWLDNHEALVASHSSFSIQSDIC